MGGLVARRGAVVEHPNRDDVQIRRHIRGESERLAVVRGISNFADEFLKDIFQSDHAEKVGFVVNHSGHVRAPTLEGLERIMQQGIAADVGERPDHLGVQGSASCAPRRTRACP